MLLPGDLAERDRVLSESNFAAIDATLIQMREAMFKAVRQVLSEQSRTPHVVKIKAQACATLGRMDSYDQRMGQLHDSSSHDDSMAELLGKAMLEVGIA